MMMMIFTDTKTTLCLFAGAAGMVRLQAGVGPWGVRLCRYPVRPVGGNLAAWHCPIQQVSLSHSQRGATVVLSPPLHTRHDCMNSVPAIFHLVAYIISSVKAKLRYTIFPVASPQQVRNINDKSVISGRCQLPHLRGRYGETCVMDFDPVSSP